MTCEYVFWSYMYCKQFFHQCIQALHRIACVWLKWVFLDRCLVFIWRYLEVENEWLFLVVFSKWLVWICASSYWVVLSLFVLETYRSPYFLPLEVLVYCCQVTSQIFFDELSRLTSLNIFTSSSEINFYLPLSGLRSFFIMPVLNIIYHATIFELITCNFLIS